MEIIKELSGHSGCKIFLYKGRDFHFVRKISSGVSYNCRLHSQYKKQLSWSLNSSPIKTPKIINYGYIEGLFYFDMEFVFGSSLATLLDENKIEGGEIERFYTSHYQYQYDRKRSSDIVLEKYSKKINDLNRLKGKYDNFYNMHYALELLNSKHWISKYTTNIHGDMTFENIIKCKYSNDIYMIDFLDDFSNILYADLSKVFQDLIGQWSFIDKSTCRMKYTNSTIKLLNIRKNLIDNIVLIEGNNEWLEKTIYGLLLNYIRIIPYIKNKNMFTYVDGVLEKIIKIIENDDYINQLR